MRMCTGLIITCMAAACMLSSFSRLTPNAKMSAYLPRYLVPHLIDEEHRVRSASEDVVAKDRTYKDEVVNADGLASLAVSTNHPLPASYTHVTSQRQMADLATQSREATGTVTGEMFQASSFETRNLPRFYILSGQDLPAINIDICGALPFSWHTAS